MISFKSLQNINDLSFIISVLIKLSKQGQRLQFYVSPKGELKLCCSVCHLEVMSDEDPPASPFSCGTNL